VQRYPSSARAGEAVSRLARAAPADEARSLLRSALDGARDPSAAAELALELGELESRAQDFAAARRAYERALATDGTAALAPQLAPLARYGLAFACAARGDDAAAERALAPLLAEPERAASPEAGVRAAAFELGVALRVRAGDPGGALARWSELERCGVAVPRALASLRPILPALTTAGRARAAESALARLAARARGAEAAELEMERGWLALAAGDARGAAQAIERASGSASGTTAGTTGGSTGGSTALAELRLACGDALSQAGEPAAARAQFQAAAAAGPTVLDRALVRLAWSRLEAGEDRAALGDLERFERECAASPDRGRALTLRGEALWRLGQHAECATVLTAAREIVRDPALRAVVLERLGDALARTERWRESADVLAEFTREFPRAPGVPQAELVRGRALARVGDARGARACLERALASGGAIAARARVERARLARAAGDLDGALSDALKAALLVDDAEASPEALLIAAEILAEQGDVAAARARLAELVERYPRSPAGVRARELSTADGAPAPKSRGGKR
jgi:tetratricopeptide (TPR) repeat protein